MLDNTDPQIHYDCAMMSQREFVYVYKTHFPSLSINNLATFYLETRNVVKQIYRDFQKTKPKKSDLTVNLIKVHNEPMKHKSLSFNQKQSDDISILTTLKEEIEFVQSEIKGRMDQVQALLSFGIENPKHISEILKTNVNYVRRLIKETHP